MRNIDKTCDPTPDRTLLLLFAAMAVLAVSGCVNPERVKWEEQHYGNLERVYQRDAEEARLMGDDRSAEHLQGRADHYGRKYAGIYRDPFNEIMYRALDAVLE